MKDFCHLSVNIFGNLVVFTNLNELIRYYYTILIFSQSYFKNHIIFFFGVSLLPVCYPLNVFFLVLSLFGSLYTIQLSQPLSCDCFYCSRGEQFIHNLINILFSVLLVYLKSGFPYLILEFALALLGVWYSVHPT